MHCFKEGASEEGDESSARSTSSSLGSRPEIARPVGLRGGAPRNRADAKGKVQDDEDLAQKGMPIRGLTNLGNTCFFNSVMQNLLRTRPFRDTMLPHLARKDGDVELEEDEEEEGVEEEGLRGSVAAFFKEMVRSGQITKMRDSVGTVKPSALLAEIIRKEPRYGGGQQHDSHELLWSVLDRLHMEEKKRLKEVAESQAGSRGEVDEHQKGKKEIGPAIVEKTYIQTIFGGNLRGTIACKKCGRESVMYEPFLDLSLPIPERFRGEGGGGFDIGEKKGKKGGKGSAAAPVEEDMSKKQRKELLKQKAKKGGTSADVAEGESLCLHMTAFLTCNVCSRPSTVEVH